MCHTSLTEYVAYMIGHQGYNNYQGIVATGGCGGTIECKDGRAPAEALIWTSLKVIMFYARYHDGLVSAAADIVDLSLKDATKKFAPVPPKYDLLRQDIRPDLRDDADGGRKVFQAWRKAEGISKTILSKSVDIGISLAATFGP
ncbi:hypothetical protein BDW66DRAFT_155547 [Aspergillus desertorum]